MPPGATEAPPSLLVSERSGAPVTGVVSLAVLLAGFYNLFRRKSPNLSQTLMRWRVVLQFIAICIVMAAIYLSGK